MLNSCFEKNRVATNSQNGNKINSLSYVLMKSKMLQMEILEILLIVKLD